MHHHHYRGKLLQGEKVRLDPANVYIDIGSTGGDAPTAWSGYLLVESEKELEAGGTYTLRLVDGRAGELRNQPVCP